MFHTFFGTTVNGGPFRGFDDCRAKGPGVYADAVAWVSRQRGVAPTSTENLLVAGWSEKDQRMRAFVLLKEPDQPLMLSTLPEGTYLAPGAMLEPSMHAPTTDEAMMALARRQLRWMLDETPAEATGGDLIIAELTRYRTVIRNLGAIQRDAPEAR